MNSGTVAYLNKYRTKITETAAASVSLPRQEDDMKTKKEKAQKEENKKDKGAEGAKEASSNPILAAIAQARLHSKPRGFSQTWDFIINAKGLNLKKPENRFAIDVALPKGRGKEAKVCIFADAGAAEAAKVAAVVVRKEEVVGMAKNRARLSDVLSCDVILGEPQLMAMVGKELGPVLAPKGKMPRPIPPNVKLDAFVAASKKLLRVALKESPAIHTMIGNDRMPDDDVAANAEAIFNAVRDKLPKGLNNIKSVVIKLTMGRPVRVMMK